MTQSTRRVPKQYTVVKPYLNPQPNPNSFLQQKSEQKKVLAELAD